MDRAAKAVVVDHRFQYMLSILYRVAITWYRAHTSAVPKENRVAVASPRTGSIPGACIHFFLPVLEFGLWRYNLKV